MSGNPTNGHTESPSSTTEAKKTTGDFFVVAQGFQTIKWKDYLQQTLAMQWLPEPKIWVIGNLNRDGAEWIEKEIHLHCKHSRHSKIQFSVWVDEGGEYGSLTPAAPQVENVTHWRAVSDKAMQFLEEGRASGIITRKEELGYMGAIAILEDRKSRPADKKGAIDLMLRLEGVFEDRNKGSDEGEQAQGTKDLIDSMNKKTDGSD